MDKMHVAMDESDASLRALSVTSAVRGGRGPCGSPHP